MENGFLKCDIRTANGIGYVNMLMVVYVRSFISGDLSVNHNINQPATFP